MDVISLKVFVDTVKGVANIKNMVKSLGGLGESSKSADKDLNRLKQELLETNKQLTNAAKDVNTTEKEFQELSSKASFLAKRIKVVEKNSESASDDLEDIGKSAGKANDGVDNLGSGLKSFLSIAAVLGTVKKGLGIASELEDYRNTLEVVMKDTQKAGDMFQWAVDKANRTPFDTKDVVAGAVRLESYGLSAKAMMDNIGDMAAVMNTDLMSAVEAVADAQNGELERLKAYGLTKKKIVEQADKMGFKGLINNKGQITDLDKFNKALQALMKESFSGGMDRKAKTLSGALSTVSGVTGTTLAALMGVSGGTVLEGTIFDLVKDGAISLGNTLIELNESGTLEDTAKDIGVLSQVTGVLFLAFGAYKVVTLATGAFNAAKKSLNGLTVAQWALNKAMAMNPIGRVISGIVILIGLSYIIYKNWDHLKDRTLQLWDALDNNPLGRILKFYLKWLNPIGLVINSLRTLYNLYKKFKGNNKVKIELEETVTTKDRRKGSGKRPKPRPDGSHRTGLSYVPKDGYIAELHRGERVLTEKENKGYKGNLNSGRASIQIGDINIHFNGIKKFDNELDLDKLANKMAEKVLSKIVPNLEITLANI